MSRISLSRFLTFSQTCSMSRLIASGTAPGSILTMTKISVVGRVPGLNALPPSMAPICTVGSMNLWGILR